MFLEGVKMTDTIFQKLVKSFNNDEMTAEKIFEIMESAIPFTARCRECVHRHNAMRGGTNIFCSCVENESDYAFTVDYDANSCKHFAEKSEKTDEIEKRAIEVLMREMRER